MGVQIRFLTLVVIGMVLGLAVVAHPDEGIAIFYRPPYVPSACYGNESQGILVTGVNSELWNNGAACGKYYEVKCLNSTDPYQTNACTGSSVIVKVVDFCREPCNGDFLLSQDAMYQITYAGKIYIEYKELSTPVQSAEASMHPQMIEGGPRVA